MIKYIILACKQYYLIKEKVIKYHYIFYINLMMNLIMT